MNANLEVPDLRPLSLRERMEWIYAIFDGIPEDRIDLKAWLTTRAPKPTCGTIACGGGFLALHPRGKELGLRLKSIQWFRPDGSRGFTVRCRGRVDFDALAEAIAQEAKDCRKPPKLDPS
jgi:hypothetical protein